MMADAHSAKDEHIALMWFHMAYGAKFLWRDLCNSIIKNNKDTHKRIELISKLDINYFDEMLDVRNSPLLKKHAKSE